MVVLYPAASSWSFFHQVWDEQLARSAEAWATQCIWAHGPSQLMKYVGQNLSIHSGRYRSVVDLVKSWSEEKRYYSFPAPKDCAPHCPQLCRGPVCSHYTQMVWASSSRLGCALHTCNSIHVWGSTWQQAVYLVCNYAINLDPKWLSQHQALGLLSKELKIKDHTDVQKQQDNFIRSKAILQVIRGDIVVIDRVYTTDIFAALVVCQALLQPFAHISANDPTVAQEAAGSQPRQEHWLTREWGWEGGTVGLRRIAKAEIQGAELQTGE
ncbi:Peptidase inhibitor R3HDML [Microtus ochrogaster]|uniref:Peptidase inhibitor R3HDML n=1 Tax=Microtus ochrogaster TaxID=79684 RepID=A0A8J6G173_MICOH|nr:Peptidase inhibitor R3HDML [Microtus ochrogaster]